MKIPKPRAWLLWSVFTHTHVQHLIYKHRYADVRYSTCLQNALSLEGGMCIFFTAIKENWHRHSCKLFAVRSNRNAAQNHVTKRTDTTAVNGRVGDITTGMLCHDKVLLSVIIIIFFLPRVGLCNYLGNAVNIHITV